MLACRLFERQHGELTNLVKLIQNEIQFSTSIDSNARPLNGHPRGLQHIPRHLLKGSSLSKDSVVLSRSSIEEDVI